VDRKAWQSDEGRQLAQEVFIRLVTGRPLDGLSLDEQDSRLDLRGFAIPERQVRQALVDRGAIPAEQVRRPEITDGTLDSLDFTGSTFDSLRLFGTTIRNCVFDEARFKDLRAWRTRVHDCSFRHAKLPGAVLGTLEDGMVNNYVDVDFSSADLQRISCQYASFTNVDFSNAKLVDINFRASTFTRCVFAGRVDRVIFWDRPPTSELPVRNDMEDVDLSKAELLWVEFRGLRLDRVKLPTENGHVVVKHYRCVLKRAIERFAGVNSFAAVCDHELHWAHPEREVGIWHREELGKTDEERDEILIALRQFERECTEDS
jgi:uncharacterized protein YjbI with pentapeptide repeats